MFRTRRQGGADIPVCPEGRGTVGRQECLPHRIAADRNVYPTGSRQTGMSTPPDRGRQECLPHRIAADRNVYPTGSRSASPRRLALQRSGDAADQVVEPLAGDGGDQ